MNEPPTAAEVYERIEAYALAGARDDPRPEREFLDTDLGGGAAMPGPER